MLLEVNTLDHAISVYGSKGYRLTVVYPKNALNDQLQPVNYYPGLVFLHGGGWSGGSRNGQLSLCHAIAREGVVVGSIDYTLATAANAPSLPAVMVDIAEAVAHVRSYSCVSGQRVGVGGASAGGHLALLYAMTQSPDIDFCLSFSGPTSLPEFAAHQLWQEAITYLLGVGYTEAQLLAASPMHASLDGLDTPVALLQGEQDIVLSMLDAVPFYERLVSASKPCSLARFQEGDHTLTNCAAKAAGVAYYGVTG